MTRRWSSRVAGSVAVAMLSLFGSAITVVAVVHARDEARARGQRALDTLAEQFSVRLQSSAAALRGSDAMAADSTVESDEFAAFASDILPQSDFVALAYSDVVADKERARWERITGHEMVDVRDGTLVSAVHRDVHVVVRFVQPVDERTLPLYGMDLLSDPTRAEGVDAAGANGDSVVGPIALASSGAPGIFLTRAVNSPDGIILGYVSAGISLDKLLAGDPSMPGVEPTTLWIGARPAQVGPSGGEALRAAFSVGGRGFVLEGHPTVGPQWAVAISLATLSAVLLVGLGIALFRGRRDRRRRERAAERALLFAELREALAGTSTVRDVERVIVTGSGRALGADWIGLRRIDPDDGDLVTLMAHDTITALHVPVEAFVVGADDVMGLSRCLLEGAVMTSTARQVLQRRRRSQMSDGRIEPRSTICVPMSLDSGPHIGAVGFSWRRALPDSEMEDAVNTAQLLAQLAGRAIERALVREVVQRRVEQFSDFARRLSAARSTTQIRSLVDDEVARLLDVDEATLGALDVPVDRQVREYLSPDINTPPLSVVLRSDREWTPTLHALAEALIDMIQGAWARASDHDQEQQVLQRLQTSLLTTPPDVEGYDIAVRYRSALSTVEIGGDWYSVIDLPGTLHLLVGDVAGHGPGAVAIMAETKTILRHLLSNGTRVDDALGQASDALMRRHAYASVVAVSIDKATSTFECRNAGHPFPILDGPAGTVVLDEIHRPWLGIEAPMAAPTTRAFDLGARLLLYSDGLVEDRVRPIDECIAGLAQSVAALPDPPSLLADRLLSARTSDTSPFAVDDDIAIIAVARR